MLAVWIMEHTTLVRVWFALGEDNDSVVLDQSLSCRSLPNVQAQHRSSLMPKGSPMVATVPTYHHPLLPKEPQPNGALPILFSH